MKEIVPFLVLCIALLLSVVSLVGEGGYPQLQALRSSLDRQRDKNQELQDYVESLQRQVYRLKHNNRALEKAVRDELGMARPNELVFFFDKSGERKEKKITKEQ